MSTGPDQRRSESTGSDGITRGSYSYLDDSGVQRTIEYVAGPGIGYRIISNQIGPGSHVPVPQPPFNPANPTFLSSPGSTLSPVNSPERPGTAYQPGNSNNFPGNSNNLNQGDDGEEFTPPPPSGTGGSSFYDPAYRDIEGLKPPTVYNPYEGAYKSYFGTISSTPNTFIPPPSVTFLPPKPFISNNDENFNNLSNSPTDGFSHPDTFSPLPSPSPTYPPPPPLNAFSGPTFAPPFGWNYGPKYPAQVVNVDLYLPGRAPSPSDALRRDTTGGFRNVQLPPVPSSQVLPSPVPPYREYNEVLRYAAQTNAIQSNDPEINPDRYAARVQEIPKLHVQATPVPKRYAGNAVPEQSLHRTGTNDGNRLSGSVTNCERYNNEFNCSVRKQRGGDTSQPFNQKKRNIVVEKRKQQEQAQKSQQVIETKDKS